MEATGRIVGAILLMSISLVAVSALLSRSLGHNRPMQSGFMLATAFPNAGNMGLPVALLAFGQEGLAVAVIIFASQAILGWSLGVFIAARSHNAGLGPLKQTLKLPVVWAIGLAFLLRVTDTTLPLALAQPLEMLGQASIPIMLLILGFQLEKGVALDRGASLLAALGLRLIGSAVLAYLVSELLGLEGVAQHTFIVMAAMPTAVFTIILATEFDAEPRFVSSQVIASSLLGFLTLTVLIMLLQSFGGSI
ncbi:AEC family transporter [Pseudomonas putida]|uniref:Auxin Efflux Carrier n=1 Tax=Pseudomonas putida TaxID=303 RepID=A0A1L7NM87_PSEPU|nr:Auxin Efflux Carrier [Pseudomonas putida]